MKFFLSLIATFNFVFASQNFPLFDNECGYYPQINPYQLAKNPCNIKLEELFTEIETEKELKIDFYVKYYADRTIYGPKNYTEYGKTFNSNDFSNNNLLYVRLYNKPKILKKGIIKIKEHPNSSLIKEVFNIPMYKIFTYEGEKFLYEGILQQCGLGKQKTETCIILSKYNDKYYHLNVDKLEMTKKLLKLKQ